MFIVIGKRKFRLECQTYSHIIPLITSVISQVIALSYYVPWALPSKAEHKWTVKVTQQGA